MNVRQTLVGFIGGLTLAFASERAVGYPVTWQFTGEVTAVFDPNDLLSGAVTVGTPFSGSYTFESTTQDNSPDVPSSGFFVGAITAVSGELGGIPFSGPVGSDNSILVLNDSLTGGFDNYSIFARVDFLGEGAGFSINLRDPSGTMFSSDSLVLSPPALELLDPDRTGFTLGFSTEDLGIGGELISLTPEPGALALLVVGSLAKISRRRRAERRSSSRRTGSTLQRVRSIAPLMLLANSFPLVIAAQVSATDCNNNGIDDTCDIDCAARGCSQPCGNSRDCNANSLPDECELAQCPPIELVFLIDTSGSTENDLQPLCDKIEAVISNLTQTGLTVNAETLNIGLVRLPAPSTDCPCCTDTVPNVYGTTAPGLPEELGDCPNDEGPAEDWGPATAETAPRRL